MNKKLCTLIVGLKVIAMLPTLNHILYVREILLVLYCTGNILLVLYCTGKYYMYCTGKYWINAIFIS